MVNQIKQFESLGKAAGGCVAQDQRNARYLTTVVYEQIKALEDRGAKPAKAAAVAQKHR